MRLGNETAYALAVALRKNATLEELSLTGIVNGFHIESFMHLQTIKYLTMVSLHFRVGSRGTGALGRSILTVRIDIDYHVIICNAVRQTIRSA